jgi:predicted NBD/HSP70 family sugar kinase
VQLPTKATHRQTREFNVRLVLRTLYDLGPVSRADVARATHLTRTTVSDVVTELFDRGMVETVGRGPSSGGKAPILLRVPADARNVIGLDLGETAFTGALVNLRGEISHLVELPVEGRDGADALALVDQLVERLRHAATGALLGIGVGTPGVVDTPSGTIRRAVNLDWQDLPLGPHLSERSGLPVFVANDSQAAALAEYVFGAGGRRTPNLVAVKVGRGVGAGIVLGGELFQGDGHAAGEIGHVVVVEDGVQCRCGRFGCLETVASARAITLRYRQLRDGADGPARNGHDDPSLATVRAALEQGDPAARTAVVEAGQFLGQAIGALVGALDIHLVVLHGGVIALGEPLLRVIRDAAAQRSLPLLSGKVDIRPVELEANLVVLGASAMLLTSELGLSVSR